VVAVASAGSARPLRVAAAVDGRQPVTPPPRPHTAALMARANFKGARAAGGFGPRAVGRRPRAELPARLTPEAVREMLSRVRVDAEVGLSEKFGV